MSKVPLYRTLPLLEAKNDPEVRAFVNTFAKRYQIWVGNSVRNSDVVGNSDALVT